MVAETVCAKLHVIDSMVQIVRKSYVLHTLLIEKEYKIKQRNRSFSLSNWKRVNHHPNSAVLVCLWHQHSYCLFFPYGNIWLSCSVVAVEQALTVFSGKKIGVWVTSTCILMRAFFLCKMKCVAGKVTSGRKKSMSKKHNVQTWTIFLIRPS